MFSKKKEGKKEGKKKEDEKKFEITNEFYFLFYAQDQLQMFDEDAVIINLIDNLRLNEKLKKYITDFLDNQNPNKFQIIRNITQFNYFHRNNKKHIKLKYVYYILYLFNVYFNYNYKILHKLIENELLKFDITIEILNDNKIFTKNLYKPKIMSKSYERDEYIIDYMEIDDSYLFYFPEDIINKINKIDKRYVVEIINFLMKNNKNIFFEKKLYSSLNVSITDLIDNRKIYKFGSSLPDYNSILEKLIFSFTLTNKSNSIKLSLLETQKFSSILKNNRLKETLYNSMKEKGYKKTYVSKILEELKKNNFPSKIELKDIKDINNIKKDNYFFNLDNTLKGNNLKNTLNNTKDNALKIIKYLRQKTNQKYDSYIIVKKNSKKPIGFGSSLKKTIIQFFYQYSYVFDSKNFNNKIIQSKNNILENIDENKN